MSTDASSDPLEKRADHLYAKLREADRSVAAAISERQRIFNEYTVVMQLLVDMKDTHLGADF